MKKIIISLLLSLALVFPANAESDWGVSYREKGKRPVGNISAEKLAENDAYYVGKDEKVIYLTFDAGYENGYTDKILDTLKAHNAKAAFFVVSHYISSSPETVKRMADEGHVVANHTSTHASLSKMQGVEGLERELKPVEDAYRDLTGKELDRFYRPPRGQTDTENMKNAKALNYKTVFWSLAYVDWNNNAQPEPQKAIETVLSRTHNGAIVLLHLTSKTNSEILDTLLTEWENQGYTFGSLYDL